VSFPSSLSPAFVEFDSNESASKAVEKGCRVLGRPAKISIAPPKTQSASAKAKSWGDVKVVYYLIISSSLSLDHEFAH
jgi:hypothetical protein